jgi:regulatory protein
MDLLARREHSSKELVSKLAQRFPSCEADIAIVVERLALERLQSDQRFAESYLRMRANSGFGPSRIRMELRDRGVSETIIDEAFADAGFDWFEQLQSVYQKKYADVPPKDRRELAKRQRFLHHRGFDAESIRRVCRTA